MDDRIAAVVRKAEEFRQSQGMKVADFADLLLIHRSHWYKLVSGQRHPGIALLRRLGSLDASTQRQLHELFSAALEDGHQTHQDGSGVLGRVVSAVYHWWYRFRRDFMGF